VSSRAGLVGFGWQHRPCIIPQAVNTV